MGKQQQLLGKPAAVGKVPDHILTVRIDRALFLQVSREADKVGITVSEAVRQLLVRLVAGDGDGE